MQLNECADLWVSDHLLQDYRVREVSITFKSPSGMTWIIDIVEYIQYIIMEWSPDLTITFKTRQIKKLEVLEASLTLVGAGEADT